MTTLRRNSDDPLERLLERVGREPDENRRMELLVEAAHSGPEAVRRWVERLLESQEVSDRELGAELAGTMVAPSAGMVSWATANDAFVSSIRSFEGADRAAVQAALRRVIGSTPDAATAAAMVAAGKLELNDLVPDICRHATADDDDIRASVGWSLRLLDPPDPQPKESTLVSLAYDRSATTRMWALSALSAAASDGLPATSQAARRAYRDHLHDEDDEVRYEAVKSLGLLGDVPLLAELLTDDFPPRQVFAIAAQLQDERLYEPLTEFRDSQEWTDSKIDQEFKQEIETAISASRKRQ